MKITSKNVKQIATSVSMLCEKIKYFDESNFEYKIGDDSIYVRLPGDDQGETLEIDEFLDFCQEMSEFKIINNGRIRTRAISHQIIKAESEDLEYYLKNTSVFFKEINDIELRIVEAPIYIGIACTELDAFDPDFGSGYENMLVIELKYKNSQEKLNPDKELEIIYSYLFEIADSTGFIFFLSKIKNRDIELEEKIDAIIYREEDNDTSLVKEHDFELKPLLAYVESMKIYISALQTNDAELRLLNFYKILEYYAPIVINMDSYDLLAKKLESPKVLHPNRAYLKSIFELVNSMNQRLQDSELIKSVFSKCFDFVDTFELLPKTIQGKVLGIIKEKSLTYNIKKEKISQAANIVASTLYSTRNQVVHAKSNFVPTGDECPDKDIEHFNTFLKEITARTIRWHANLSEIYK